MPNQAYHPWYRLFDCQYELRLVDLHKFGENHAADDQLRYFYRRLRSHKLKIATEIYYDADRDKLRFQALPPVVL